MFIQLIDKKHFAEQKKTEFFISICAAAAWIGLERKKRP